MNPGNNYGSSLGRSRKKEGRDVPSLPGLAQIECTNLFWGDMAKEVEKRTLRDGLPEILYDLIEILGIRKTSQGGRQKQGSALLLEAANRDQMVVVWPQRNARFLKT